MFSVKKDQFFLSAQEIFPRFPRVDNWVMLGLPSISESGMINAVALGERFMEKEKGKPKATLVCYSLSIF